MQNYFFKHVYSKQDFALANLCGGVVEQLPLCLYGVELPGLVLLISHVGQHFVRGCNAHIVEVDTLAAQVGLGLHTGDWLVVSSVCLKIILYSLFNHIFICT